MSTTGEGLVQAAATNWEANVGPISQGEAGQAEQQRPSHEGQHGQTGGDDADMGREEAAPAQRRKGGESV